MPAPYHMISCEIEKCLCMPQAFELCCSPTPRACRGACSEVGLHEHCRHPTQHVTRRLIRPSASENPSSQNMFCRAWRHTTPQRVGLYETFIASTKNVSGCTVMGKVLPKVCVASVAQLLPRDAVPVDPARCFALLDLEKARLVPVVAVDV